jgi:hypothetical protein
VAEDALARTAAAPGRRPRPADALPIVFVALLFAECAVTRTPLPFDADAIRSWAMLLFSYGLLVLVPLVPALERLPPRRRTLAGWLYFAAFLALTLFLPTVPGRDAFDPLLAAIAAAATALLFSLEYSRFGRDHRSFEPIEFVYRFSPFLIGALTYANLSSILATPRSTLDAALASMDASIWGEQPTILLERSATPLANDWFAFHYLAYAAYPIVIGLVLYASRRRARFEHAFFRIGLAMTLGNFLYVVFPARGPIRFLAYRGPLPGGILTRAVGGLIDGYGYAYDAFPSLHVCVSLLAVFSLRREFPRLFAAALFFEANLILATVWLRMHYTVDLAAGILLALAVDRIAAYVERRVDRGLSFRGLESTNQP